MKKLFILSLFIGLFWACENEKPIQEMNPAEKAQKKKDELAKLKLEVQEPIRIGQSDYLIFPLKSNLMLNRDETSSYYAYEKWDKFEPLWNIIFLNKTTKEQRLLLENQEVIILRYSSQLFKKNEYEKTDISNVFTRKMIFYEMIVKDYNGDQKLNLLDPVYLFVSDSIGKNLQRISPPNHKVVEWWTPWNDNQLIIKALRDNNQDKQFDNKDDEPSHFLIDLKKPSEYQEIIDAKFKSKLRNLYLERKPFLDKK